jgi:hypothetical protein
MNSDLVTIAAGFRFDWLLVTSREDQKTALSKAFAWYWRSQAAVGPQDPA